MATDATGRPAVLFDIDGTLVDSNYLHIQAWSESFEVLGTPVDTWRIHRAIGLDSKKLLAALLGDRVDELGDDAKEQHKARYEGLGDRLRLFQGTRELLREVARRGLQVVLATSAPQNELELLLPLLDADEWISVVTSDEDIETAKPEPDILEVALERAGVSADRAVMIGDSIWDGQSADKAGITFLGVRSGGVAEEELRSAKAVDVFDSPDDILRHLDDGPIGRLLGD
ncbi:HAD family hydrolase [Nakamurella endophytica]|uniref:Haloacid dehalogenase n=1 Tax=Nakamurella endophytica TaxID=1748367 RepID=A0A917SVV1_9ACTN|nr:HAD family hydrolase [Nakamurella endophytica]GGL97996.1 haloacid dehalogenase [Nakamurella endophytica]